VRPVIVALRDPQFIERVFGYNCVRGQSGRDYNHLLRRKVVYKTVQTVAITSSTAG
jgi:hypothetical protein